MNVIYGKKTESITTKNSISNFNDNQQMVETRTWKSIRHLTENEKFQLRTVIIAIPGCRKAVQ